MGADIDDAFQLETLCLESMGKASGGWITKEDLNSLMSKENIKAYFTARGLSITDTDTFFDMVVSDFPDEYDADRGVPIDTFIHFCVRLKGGASSLDLQLLQYQGLKAQSEIIRALKGHTSTKSVRTQATSQSVSVKTR